MSYFLRAACTVHYSVGGETHVFSLYFFAFLRTKAYLTQTLLINSSLHLHRFKLSLHKEHNNRWTQRKTYMYLQRGCVAGTRPFTGAARSDRPLLLLYSYVCVLCVRFKKKKKNHSSSILVIKKNPSACLIYTTSFYRSIIP